ncbi:MULTISPECIES: hypothetical protein [unclassified Dietzia]|uniref:hypothetical protein n=2 Tax=Dietzia TaxID=37914 RepID=UPI0015F81B1E|nr:MULTISPECIES: hypothetical protein [unclassified Dietzia]MBB1025562.1 hypothetical protein [Dietzia sp. DQ12-76]MBB1028378.1 hypothetical protein [Dietzia sp. DQ11-38-2]
MRTLTRFGVAAAATAVASATVLAGAGVAGAQGADPVLDSPSSVSVSGKGANTEISYTNRSGQDLFCIAYGGPGSLLSEMYAVLRTQDPDASPPPALEAKVTEALVNGQLGLFTGGVEDGETATLSPGFYDTNATLTDGSFTPSALAICSAGDEYIEMEISAGAGVPAGLGSLDSALAGLGSSGSVARTTGSLGS